MKWEAAKSEEFSIGVVSWNSKRKATLFLVPPPVEAAPGTQVRLIGRLTDTETGEGILEVDPSHSPLFVRVVFGLRDLYVRTKDSGEWEATFNVPQAVEPVVVFAEYAGDA